MHQQEFTEAPATLTPPDEDDEFDGSQFMGFTFVNKAYIVHQHAIPTGGSHASKTSATDMTPSVAAPAHHGLDLSSLAKFVEQVQTPAVSVSSSWAPKEISSHANRPATIPEEEGKIGTYTFK